MKRRRFKKTNTKQPLKEGSFFKPKIQTKLKFGTPGDKYEVEADKTADQVVNNTQSSDAVQKMESEEEVQKKPLASKVTPLVQKMDATDEESPVQAMEEEESVQKSEEEESIQAMEEENESIQAKQESNSTNQKSIENNLRNGSGGTKMDNDTKAEMESSFGADFSNVNIHTDSQAAQMSKDIGAQAFTHGNDIYFNNGKYNPNSKEGKHLLAHELTHTIQQKGMVQKKILKKDLKSHRFIGNDIINNVLNGRLLVRKGSKGAHVRIIQQALLDAGFKLPKYGVDGSFGYETKKAVVNFQIAQNLSLNEQDGIVGAITMSALDKQYTGYKTEHNLIAGDTAAEVLKNSRTITSEEKKSVKEAMTTEVKTDPKTGKLPVFDVKNKDAYKQEIRDLTEIIALNQYNQLGKGKKAKRKDPANFHSKRSINNLAKVSKNETDKVFGNIKKGPSLKFGTNIFDGWANKERQLNGKPKHEQDSIKKAWAEWRIQKIVESSRMSKINQKYGAVQSRNPEKTIIKSIIQNLSRIYFKEMVQTHLGWPGFASDGKIFLQRFKNKDNEKNRLYMWDNFGTIIHEYIHTLEHNNSRNYRKSLDEKKGGKTLREGVTDYFTKIVYKNINFKDNALRKKIEGNFYNKRKKDEPKSHYYSESKNAERLAGIVGINNLMSSFFLGKTEFIKGV